MKKKTNLLLLFCALFFAFNLNAQTSLDGKVTDDSSDPLAGVNVVVKGTSTGTSSDLTVIFQLVSIRVMSWCFLMLVIQQKKLPTTDSCP